MVFLTIIEKLNRHIGPFLLRNGIQARYAIDPGTADRPLLDACLLLPFATRLLSRASADEARRTVDNVTNKSLFAFIFSSNDNNQQDNKPTNHDPVKHMTLNSQRRVQIFESYARKALVPTEQWSNVRCWRQHAWLIKWARRDYLLAQQCDALRAAMVAYPKLRASPQLPPAGLAAKIAAKLPKFRVDGEKQFLPLLPQSELVVRALDMNDWTTAKHSAAVSAEMTKIARRLGGSVQTFNGTTIANVDAQTNLSDLSMGEILELAGGRVLNCGPLNALCEEAGIFQLWTYEYVCQLSVYLHERANAFDGETTIVLDVGAGDGLLAQCLRERAERANKTTPSTNPTIKQRTSKKQAASARQKQQSTINNNRKTNIHIVAIDDGSWGIAPKAPVEKLSVQDAMKVYCSSDDVQVVVICSWMPPDEDWTALFRAEGVAEYILIGECDDGQCGDGWKTWGDARYKPQLRDASLLGQSELDAAGEQLESFDQEGIPYQNDGYERVELTSLCSHQFSRFDCRVSRAGRTVSFRRKAWIDLAGA
jgi:hypothetical protein